MCLRSLQWVDSLKWVAWSPISHSFPPHQASTIPPNFRCHKHSRLSVTRPIRQPTRHPTVDCGIVDFFGRDRQTNLARPLQFGQGIKPPCQPNFVLKMYPIKQSCRLIAWRNPTTPEHQDVKHGVAVGRPGRFCFIAAIAFVGGMGG
jgi:hypothetical protein